MYHSNLTFVCFMSIVTCSAIFPAKDYHDHSLLPWGRQALQRVLERKPERADIVQALNILSADAIVSAFPNDPEARKDEALHLLKVYKKDQSHPVRGFRHCYYIGKRLLEVCQETQFDQWDDIHITLVARHPDICLFLIDRWVCLGNRARLHELMEQLLNGFMYRSYRTHKVLEKYLLSVPAAELHSLDALHKNLCSTFIEGALINPFWEDNPANPDFETVNTSMENAGIARFSTVCRRISSEDFEEIFESLERSSSFQHSLWKLERLFPGCFLTAPDDPYMEKFQQAKQKIHDRLEGWMRDMGLDITQFKFDYLLYHIYTDLLQEMQKRRKAAGSQTGSFRDREKVVVKENAVLRDMFDSLRSLEHFNPDDYYNVGSVLQELNGRGVKPNTKLCPADPENQNQHTLFTAFIICMCAQKESPILRSLHNVCALLSTSEFLEEIAKLQCSDEFHNGFAECRSKWKYSKCSYVKQIMLAGDNSRTLHRSLFERLWNRLES